MFISLKILLSVVAVALLFLFSVTAHLLRLIAYWRDQAAIWERYNDLSKREKAILGKPSEYSSWRQFTSTLEELEHARTNENEMSGVWFAPN